MGLKEDVADAKARRAALIDNYQMGGTAGSCAACRARAFVLAALLAAAGGWIVAGMVNRREHSS